MKLLVSRITRLEEKTGLSESDDEYLGLVTDGEEEKDDAAEEAASAESPRERWINSAISIAATMNEEHLALVCHETSERLPIEQAYGCRLDPQLSNLTRQFWLMVKLKVLDEETKIPRRYGLPPEVAQIYIDHPLATAVDECRHCGYFSPALLWTGSPTDASAQAAKALKLPLHPCFNCYQFFTRCPLCGDVTGGASEPYYLWLEFRRIYAARDMLFVEKFSQTGVI